MIEVSIIRNPSGRKQTLRIILEVIQKQSRSKPEIIKALPLKSKTIRSYLNQALAENLIFRRHDQDQMKTLFFLTPVGEEYIANYQMKQ